MKNLKIAVVNFKKGLPSTSVRLIRSEDNLEIIIESKSGDDLLSQLRYQLPDVVVIETGIYNNDIFEVIYNVKFIYPAIKIIVFYKFAGDKGILEMYMHGAKSLVSELEQPEKLIPVIALKGSYLSDHAWEIIEKKLNESLLKQVPQLNDFEVTLLQLICKGHSSSVIGRTLHKSHRTIEEHRENLYKKFGVRTKEELIVIVTKNNIVQ